MIEFGKLGSAAQRHHCAGEAWAGAAGAPPGASDSGPPARWACLQYTGFLAQHRMNDAAKLKLALNLLDTAALADPPGKPSAPVVDLRARGRAHLGQWK